MLKTTVEHVTPDHYYINGTLFNNTGTSPSTGPMRYIPCTITQTRDESFLDNPEEWNVSIVRLTVPSEDIAQITEPSIATSLSLNLQVSLKYNGVSYPTTLTVPLKPDHSGTPARKIYNIQTFINLINAAYLSSQNDLEAANPGLCPYGVVFISYDSVSGLFTLNVPTYYLTGIVADVPADGINIGMSFDLYQKLQSFPIEQRSPLTNSFDDIIFIRQYTGTNLISPSTFNFGPGGPLPNGDYFTLTQEAAWPSSIQDASRIVVTTNSLPILSEYKNSALFAQDSTQLQYNNNQSILMVTDFLAGSAVPFTPKGEPYTYLPDAFPRLTSLTGNKNLRTWDLSVYVADKYGNTPTLLQIPPKGTFDVKIMFLKKTLSN